MIAHRLLDALILTGILHLDATAAHAYLDPGSATLLLNAIVAAIVSLAITVKVYWNRIGTLLKSLVSGEDPPAIEDSSDDESSRDPS